MQRLNAQSVKNPILQATKYEATKELHGLPHGGNYPFDDDDIKYAYSTSEIKRENNNFCDNRPSGIVNIAS